MGKDVAGQRFGMLVAIEPTPERNRGNVVWKCRCDCGNEVCMSLAIIQSKTTHSCGCLRKANAAMRASTGKNHRTHGMKGTKIYGVWQGMKKRCFNPKDKSFQDYGGRGITVCDEWKNDFQMFYDYVSKLPHFGEEGYSIDRINNDGNYEPGNVRWATRTEQNNNRRQHRTITKTIAAI